MEILMKKISELELGFKDAENYKNKDFKELFNEVFVRTETLDKLCQSNVYFLLGEKGTGKTAYAVYLTNNYFKNISGSLKYIRETEYQKFVTLKREKQLNLSDYTNIWKVILFLLISKKILSDEDTGFQINSFRKFNNLNKAIDEYYAHAFSPEIIFALNFIENSKLAAELISKYTSLSGEKNIEQSFSETRFQTNLLYIQKKFEEALSSIKLKKNHLLFIDGIDLRPQGIQYEDYLECVRGLANAVWNINSDFFSSIKDSIGRMRVVLLLRPDIYQNLSLQNQNNKLIDNSVLLDWRTTYPEHRNSSLFLLTDNLLSKQQEIHLPLGKSWDYYFPYKATQARSSREDDSAFITFLRFSYFRPRDIITMLSLLKEIFVRKNKGSDRVFRESDFDSAEFRDKYADYLLGEVKDYLSFYYTNEDYKVFLKFFEFLNGKMRFRYSEYLEAFYNYKKYLSKNNINIPMFISAPDVFLQTLYNLNIICYVERTLSNTYVRWCFRERTYANIAPEIKLGRRYDIHYGISKALNVGKELRKN